MQMIVLSSLIRVPIPAHAFVFFAGCILFASIDIMDGESWYEEWFVFHETDPLNGNYDIFGIGD